MSQSFYGGKYGQSFIIVKSFSSVSEMASNFKRGSDYTTVHFDENVLINTKNKNNSENGRIYRRGYNYTNDLGGAIYIGTIVGPSGNAPMLELTTIEGVKNKQEEGGYDDRYTEGSYSVPTSLIPGKDGEKYNDTIDWACCSIRDESAEESIAYIGFRFPYTVIEFIAESVSPYYNRSNNSDNFVNQNLVRRIDDKRHPFYEKFNISIPKGIKGDAFKNFRIIEANNSIQDYQGKQDDVNHRRKVLVYDYYHYDRNDTGEPVTIYLGDYNMIDNIQINDEGTVSINYSHNDTLIYSKLFKWIKKVTLDRNNGHFKVEYNYETDNQDQPTLYETDLSWVDNISIADNGTVTLYWSTGEEENLPTSLKWVTNMEMHANGTIVVNYNDGTNNTFNNKIQWITSVSLLEDGTFTVKFNNGIPDYKTVLKWVKDIDIEDNGTVTIYYNNGDPFVYDKMIKYIDHIYFNESDNENKFHVVYNTGADEIIDNIIKFIRNVYIDNDETKESSDFKFHVVYNTGEDKPIGDPINYIVETDIDKENDYHFLIYYSNANFRKAIIQSGNGRTHKGKNGWLDLGSIKDDSGILIGLNVDLSESSDNLEDIPTAINYLNNNYPNGLTNPNVRGKIITIGGTLYDKKFYAFDYNKNVWYYLGSLTSENNFFMITATDNPNLSDIKNKLDYGGIWFILEE